jgi:LPS-assembly protein
MQRNPAEFVDFNIPWSVDVNFALTLNRIFDRTKQAFKSDLSSSLQFNNSFSLTPKWNFTTNGFYDLDTKQLTQLQLSINREMHCWQMSISVSPIGQSRFFTITISPRSSILQDLRINRTRAFYDF